MTKLEMILITLLKDNGIDKDSLIAITSMLRTPQQQEQMMKWIVANRKVSPNKVME